MAEESREALLVLERQALVARVKIDGLHTAVTVQPDSVHEPQGVCHAVDDRGVLFPDPRVDDMAKAPVKRGVKVS